MFKSQIEIVVDLQLKLIDAPKALIKGQANS